MLRDIKGFSAAILMDLSKAFDTINHTTFKLHAYGLRGTKSHKNYVSNRFQKTKIKDKFSTWKELGLE